MVFCAGGPGAAERFITLKIGPAWPKELQWSGKPTAWDGSAITGIVFDGKIALGGGLDFLWNVNKKSTRIHDNTYRLDQVEKTFMFPVSGYFAFTPIPQFRFHPCVSTQIGLNTMYYSYDSTATALDGSDTRPYDENGFYMGFYWKIAADVLFNIGESSSLFAGVDFQRTKPEKLNKKHGDVFTVRDMNGVGLRMGVRLLY